MQVLLIAVLSIHILTSVFWGGSTFVLARSGGVGAARLFAPQMAAAALVVASGVYLGHTVHGGAFGAPEKLLAAGAVSGLAAVLVQLLIAGPRLSKGDPVGAESRRSGIALAYRVSAGLIALAAVAMAASRYA